MGAPTVHDVGSNAGDARALKNAHASLESHRRLCTSTSELYIGIHRHIEERTEESTIFSVPGRRKRGSFYTLAAIQGGGHLK